jgi:hypothetical protein
VAKRQLPEGHDRQLGARERTIMPMSVECGGSRDTVGAPTLGKRTDWLDTVPLITRSRYAMRRGDVSRGWQPNSWRPKPHGGDIMPTELIAIEGVAAV